MGMVSYLRSLKATGRFGWFFVIVAVLDWIARILFVESVVEAVRPYVGSIFVNAFQEFQIWGIPIILAVGILFIWIDSRHPWSWWGKYISLHEAAIDAYTQLRRVNSLIPTMVDDSGNATNDHILNSVASVLIAARSDHYLPFEGKHPPSTDWEEISKEDAMNGRFAQSAKTFSQRKRHWTDLRVNRKAWKGRVDAWKNGPKADSTLDEIFGNDSTSHQD